MAFSVCPTFRALQASRAAASKPGACWAERIDNLSMEPRVKGIKAQGNPHLSWDAKLGCPTSAAWISPNRLRYQTTVAPLSAWLSRIERSCSRNSTLRCSSQSSGRSRQRLAPHRFGAICPHGRAVPGALCLVAVAGSCPCAIPDARGLAGQERRGDEKGN